MRLSLISPRRYPVGGRDRAFADLLHKLHGQVPNSLILSIKKLHDKKKSYHPNTVNVSNQEIYQQLLDGERLLGILEPHLDDKNNRYPPNGVSDCGVESFPSEDGNKYLVGPVAAKGHEQLWQDINVLPSPSHTTDIALGLLFGYDPIEIQKFL